MNLAVHDALLLSRALVAFYASGRMDLLDGYLAAALRRVWRAEHFSWWMTSMLHRFAGDDAFGRRHQQAQLHQVTTSAPRLRSWPRTTSACRPTEPAGEGIGMGAGVVIVGGGQAEFQVAASLRAGGYAEPIQIVSEDHPPYQQPPPSKAFLMGKMERERLLFRQPPSTPRMRSSWCSATPWRRRPGSADRCHRRGPPPALRRARAGDRLAGAAPARPGQRT